MRAGHRSAGMTSVGVALVCQVACQVTPGAAPPVPVVASRLSLNAMLAERCDFRGAASVSDASDAVARLKQEAERKGANLVVLLGADTHERRTTERDGQQRITVAEGAAGYYVACHPELVREVLQKGEVVDDR